MGETSIQHRLEMRDENALAELERKYKKLMYYVAFRILGIRGDAEECVNDALLDIWESIPPQKPDNLETFALLVVRRRAIDRLEYNRAQKRFAPTTPLEEIEELIADETDLDDGFLAGLLNEFMSKLPQEDRRVFLQRYYLCQSIDEIAANFAIKPGTVFSKLSRTKEKLRKHLAENGVKL